MKAYQLDNLHDIAEKLHDGISDYERFLREELAALAKLKEEKGYVGFIVDTVYGYEGIESMRIMGTRLETDKERQSREVAEARYELAKKKRKESALERKRKQFEALKKELEGDQH